MKNDLSISTGMKCWSNVSQAQVILLVILLAAIADFLFGTLIGPKSDSEYVKGFIGYNGV